MLYMKENGSDEQQLSDVKIYLDRVKKADKNFKDLPMLWAMYKELVSEDDHV